MTWPALLAAHEQARDSGRTATPNHAPVAAILTCADARVSPAAIFDQPPGELFVTRVAGNTAAPAVVASLDYAVAVLGVELVVVLGHSDCGAVAAAAAGNAPPHLDPITQPIRRLAEAEAEACVDAGELTERNVVATAAALASSSSPLGEAIRSGSVELIGAVYDLAQDRVTPVSVHPISTNPQSATERP